jgi:hypothetical protein
MRKPGNQEIRAGDFGSRNIRKFVRHPRFHPKIFLDSWSPYKKLEVENGRLPLDREFQSHLMVAYTS